MMDWSGLPVPANAPARGTCVRIERPEPGLVVLTLDPPHRERTVLDVPLWRDLALAIESVDPDAGDRGLVITGREPLHFAYGADLDAIESVTDPAVVRRLTLTVHEVLIALERLQRGNRVCTVAAVGGPVPGGALELSLACRYVVAAEDRSTRLGLPETKLGILPAWGGTHRLPKKIGVPAALPAILTGRLYDARRAKKMGIVDRVTKPEYLERVARDIALGREKLKRKKRFFARWLVDKNPAAAALIERKALKAALKKTRGRYPALEVVIPIVVGAPRTGRRDAAAKEADAVARLATGSVCKSLVSLFRSSEAAKKLAQDESGAKPPRIERAAVVGAGVMGAEIASLLAERGVATRLADLSDEALDRALVSHQNYVVSRLKRRRMKKHEATAALDHLDGARGLVGLGRSQVVIEAVAERLDVKRSVLSELAAAVGPDALLASNTSSLSVTAIAKGIDHPERVVGLHFFNPVRRMPLVEIIPGAATSDECVRRAVALAVHLGKTPVVVQDVAGFLVNRLLGPYLDEALRLLAGGVAPGRLDSLLVDFGMPMGPLRLLDEVGLDIAQHAANSLHEAYGERMAPCDVLADWVESGRLGRKTGMGFYDWSNEKKPEFASDLHVLRKGDSLAGISDESIIDRCVLSMVNEAARCLDEEVVTGPTELDLATVFGMGFAPFRGGLLRHADEVGARALVEKLIAVAESSDVADRPGGSEKFAPAEFIERLATEGGSFHAPPPAPPRHQLRISRDAG